MDGQVEITNLGSLLDRVDEAAGDRDRVSIDLVLNAVGRRAFGPVLLIPGLIGFSPLSGVPGMPTLVGLMVLLVGGQMLVGRDELWLPDFVLRRSVSRERFDKAMKLIRPVARYVDRLLRPRLHFLTGAVAVRVIAAVCVLMAAVAPLMEFLPFAISAVGAAVSAFALALLAQDGVFALVAFAICGAAAGVVVGVAL